MSFQKPIRVNLGLEGIEHIRKRIGSDEYTRGKPLRRALATLPIEQGQAWTWAPEGTVITSDDLRNGLPTGITQTVAWQLLTDFVVDILEGAGRLALVEDHDASPYDQWLTTETNLPATLASGRHLYWYATEPDSGAVGSMMRWGFGLFKCMALTPSPLPSAPSGALAEADVEKLGLAADHIVVDAFDFEGFVV